MRQLLNSHSERTNRTVQAVRRANAVGLKVCLVSGRRPRSMGRISDQIGLNNPLVAQWRAIRAFSSVVFGGTLERQIRAYFAGLGNAGRRLLCRVVPPTLPTFL